MSILRKTIFAAALVFPALPAFAQTEEIDAETFCANPQAETVGSVSIGAAMDPAILKKVLPEYQKFKPERITAWDGSMWSYNNGSSEVPAQNRHLIPWRAAICQRIKEKEPAEAAAPTNESLQKQMNPALLAKLRDGEFLEADDQARITKFRANCATAFQQQVSLNVEVRDACNDATRKFTTQEESAARIAQGSADAVRSNRKATAMQVDFEQKQAQQAAAQSAAPAASLNRNELMSEALNSGGQSKRNAQAAMSNYCVNQCGLVKADRCYRGPNREITGPDPAKCRTWFAIVNACGCPL